MARGTMARRWRREVVPVVLLVLTLVGLPAAPSLGVPPDSPVRSLAVIDWQVPSDAPVDGVRQPAARVDWITSTELPAGAAVMVGAEWGGDTSTEVEVRSRRGTTWTPWRPLTVEDEDRPDPGSAEAARSAVDLSAPVWVGTSDALQLRYRGGPVGPVRLHVVDSVGGDGLGYQPPQTRGIGGWGMGGWAEASTTQPGIIDRAGWGADESLRTYLPLDAGRARFGVVHHTAGSNSYTPEEADDVVRSIYAYHTQAQGWDDIGYNFLIDRYGRVYEGRSGGITNAIIGAHAAGWNAASFGVSVMGDFTSTDPTAASLDALQRLFAWKMDIHHIDPHGTTVERAGGGSSNRFDRGVVIELPTIIGHRDTNNTSCPGTRLYAKVAQLPDMIEPIGLPKAYGGPRASVEQPAYGIRPRWDVDLTEAMNWRLVITDADGKLVRSTGGNGLSVALEWDLLDGDGDVVAPGAYHAKLTAWTGNREVTPVDTDFVITPAAERVAGTDRISTAVALSSRSFPSAQRVVLASAGAFPDALVATPLGGSLGSPVLLVPEDRIPDAVVAEIRRLGSDKAYLIGGPGRLSPGIEDQLANELGFSRSRIVRLAGSDRFATAAAVADVVIDREDPDEVVLALGAHADPDRAFPDALSAGAFGALLGLPVLLTEPTRLPAATAAALDRRWPDGVTVFGGPGAISPDVEALASGHARGAATRRFAGGDRYDTSRIAANEVLRRRAEEVEADGPDPAAEPTGLEVVLSSGANWPDALGAGAAGARRGALFLLAAPDTLDRSSTTRAWLAEHAASLAHAIVSGGPNAISDEVLADVATQIASDGYHRQPTAGWPPDPYAAEVSGIPLPGPTGPFPTGTASPTASPAA